jgi:HK97 family phage major capsid protein
MSKRLNELRRDLHEKINAMRGLHNKAEQEKRNFTTEEQATYSAAKVAAEELRSRIEREEELADGQLKGAKPLQSGDSFGDAVISGQRSVAGAEIRSGKDWTRLFEHSEDADLRSARDRGELNIAEFVRAVAGMRTSNPELMYRVLGVGTDSAGGFMVPSVLMPGVLDALAPASSLIQAGASMMTLDVGAKDATWAGVETLPTAGWRAENAAVPESDPVFRGVRATPRSLAFYFKISRELLMDVQNLEGQLSVVIGQAFAAALDAAGLRGTGTAPTPRGVLNTVGIQAVTNGANGASLATLRWANLMTALQSILTANGPLPTAAIMSPRSFVGFGNLVDTTNQPLQRPTPLQPVQFISTPAIPNNLTVGTSTDCSEIYCGNFRSVGFVMRERPSIQLLSERFAEVGQVAFLCHVRADVIVTYPSTLAVVTGVRP